MFWSTNLRSRLPTSRELPLASHAKIVHSSSREQRTANREPRTGNTERGTSNFEPRTIGRPPYRAPSQLPKDRHGPGKVQRPESVGAERGLAAMSQGQPCGELTRGSFGRGPVERHHGRRHSWQAAQLGAPSVAHRRHLDVVRTAGDRFFEMMNGHSWGSKRVVDFTQASHAIKRNGSRRHRPQVVGRTIIGRSRRRKICVVRFSTGYSRSIHRFSTSRACGSALCVQIAPEE